jgi:hypothetical protein
MWGLTEHAPKAANEVRRGHVCHGGYRRHVQRLGVGPVHGVARAQEAAIQILDFPAHGATLPDEGQADAGPTSEPAWEPMEGGRRHGAMRVSRHAPLMALLGLLAVAGACTLRTGPTSSPTAGAFEVTGQVTAGPTCPVVTDPPRSGCEERPVEGAVVLIQDSSGKRVARATSDADGSFRVTLAPGRYRVVPQPVDGLMGTAEEQAVTLRAGSTPPALAISYDTGIR